MRERQLKQIQTNLLKSKGWGYLRYLHLLDFIQRHASEIQSVGVVGAGYGFAELAIALEFPNIQFLLTDVIDDRIPRRPNYFQVMHLVTSWNVLNVRFSIWDLLKPPPARFDVVASTEVLEHIKDATLAMKNKIAAAKKFAYTLAPFATAQQNANPERRVAAFAEHQHFVCGFDAEFFQQVGRCTSVEGAYWMATGNEFRKKLMNLSPPEIEADADALIAEARHDLKAALPAAGQCMAIKSVIAGGS